MSGELRFAATVDTASGISSLKSLEAQFQNTQNILNQLAGSFPQAAGEVTKFEQAIQQSSQSANEFGQSASSINQSTTQAAQGFTQLSGAVEQTNPPLDTFSQASASTAQSLDSLAQTIESATQPFAELSTSTADSATSFQELSQTVDGMGAPFENLSTSTAESATNFEALSTSIDGMGAPFQTLNTATTEYNTTLDASGQAVTTFQSTSATLNDLLGQQTTQWTATKDETALYTEGLTQLDPALQGIDSNVQSLGQSLGTHNTLVNDVSLSTEQYTGALANVGTNLENTTQATEATNVSTKSYGASVIQLGTGIGGLVSSGLSLINSFEAATKASTAAERSQILLEKSFVAVTTQVQALDKFMAENNITSEASVTARAALSEATSTYTDLIKAGITSGEEFTAAEQNLNIAVDAMTQAMIASGVEADVAEKVMTKYSTTIQTTHIRALQDTQKENDAWQAQLRLIPSIIGTVSGAIGTMSGIVQTLSSQFKDHRTVVDIFRDGLNALRGGLSDTATGFTSLGTAMTAAIIGTGIGAAILIITKSVEEYNKRLEESNKAVEQMHVPLMSLKTEQAGWNESLNLTNPNLKAQVTNIEANTQALAESEKEVSVVRQLFSDWFAMMGKGFVSIAAVTEDFVNNGIKALGDAFNWVNDPIKETDNNLQKAFKTLAQGDEQIKEDNKNLETMKLTWIDTGFEVAKATDPKPLQDFESGITMVGGATTKTTESISSAGDALLETDKSFGLFNETQRNAIMGTDQFATTLQAAIQAQTQGRVVTKEAALEFDAWRKSVDLNTISQDQFLAKINELFPVIDQVKAIREEHTQALADENAALVEEAINMGVSADKVREFTVGINESTGEVTNSNAEIEAMNAELIRLQGGHVDVKNAVKDTTDQMRLWGEGVKEAKTDAEDFLDSIIRSIAYNDQYNTSLEEQAHKLKLELDPALKSTNENLMLLIKTTDGSLDSLKNYANAIKSEMAPAFEQMSGLAEGMRQGFSELAGEFANNKKEVMNLLDALPKDVQHLMKINMKAEVNAQEVLKALDAEFKNFVRAYESVEIPTDINITAENAQESIEALKNQVGEYIANASPIEAARMKPLFDTLSEGAEMEGPEVQAALQAIMQDPATWSVVQGGSYELGRGGIAGFVQAWEAETGQQFDPILEKNLLASEATAGKGGFFLGEVTGQGLIDSIEGKGVEIPETIEAAIRAAEANAILTGGDIGDASGQALIDKLEAQGFKIPEAVKQAILAAAPESEKAAGEVGTKTGDAHATATTTSITQNAELQGAPGAALSSSETMSKLQQAGEKGGEEYMKGMQKGMLIKADPTKGDISDIQMYEPTGGGKTGLEKPIDVPAPNVTAYNTALAAMVTRATQTGTQIVAAFTTEFAKIGAAFTNSSASVLVAMTQLNVRAAQVGTQIVASFQTQFARIGPAFTTSSASVLVAMTQLNVRAAQVGVAITAAFTVEFNKLGPAFTTASARVIVGFTQMQTRAAQVAVAITASYTTEFNKLGPAFTTASAPVLVAMTALQTRSAQVSKEMVTLFSTAFTQITTASTTMFTALLADLETYGTTTMEALDLIIKGWVDEAFAQITEGSKVMFIALLADLELYGVTTMEALDLIIKGWTEAFEKQILEMMSNTFASLIQMIDPGFIDVNTNALEQIVEDWTTSWQEDIMKAVSETIASMDQMVQGFTTLVEAECKKLITAMENAMDGWVEAVQQAREDMEEEFDQMVEAAEEAAAKIKAAMSSANSGSDEAQFGFEEIVEAGENRMILVGEGFRREKVTITPEGAGSFNSAADFGGNTNKSNNANFGSSQDFQTLRDDIKSLMRDSGSGFGSGSTVPVNVTINETRNDYLDSDKIGAKVNRRVYKGISGSIG